MAIKYIGSNLLPSTMFASGTFETEPSSWFGTRITDGFYYQRYTLEFHQGAHSCLIGYNGALKTEFFFGYFSPILKKNKLYEFSIWVKNDATNPFCHDEASIEIVGLHHGHIEVVERNIVPMLTPKGAWTKLHFRMFVKPESTNDSPQIFFSINIGRANVSPQFSTTGFLYMDNAQLLEYVVEGEPTPEPEPPAEPTDPEPEPEPGPNQPIANIFFYHNPITVEITATGNTLLENFQIRNTVMINKNLEGTQFLSVLTMDLEPDINKISEFWANAAFKSYLKAVPPALTDTGIIRIKDRITRFRYKYGEMSGAQFEPAVHSYKGDYLVLLGGISKEVFPDFDFFNTYLPAKKKFLTWQPEVKKIDHLQEEFLYFILWGPVGMYTAPAVVNLKVKIYFTDSTNSTHTLKTLSNPGLGWILQLPAGYANSGVKDISPEKVILKYDLWLEDATTVLSEIRTYIVEQEVHPYARYFIFRNSLSGYDTVRTTGLGTKAAKLNREEIEKFLPAGYTQKDGQYATINAELQNEYDVSSGHVNKRYADYLQDMLLGNDVFEIVKGKRLPVIISNSQAVLDENKRNLWYVRFDVKSAYKNKVYTPEI